MNTDVNVRYHGLDALRAFAMLLGLPLHAALVFHFPDLAEGLGFPGAVPALDMSSNTFLLWVHMWRMPVFFVIAGFFALMVVRRKGHKFFFADRCIRIFGTLLVFSQLLNLITEEPFDALGHLWFLYYLSMALGIFICAHWAWARFMPAALGDTIMASFNRLTYLLIWLAPLSLLTMLARDRGVEAFIPETFWNFNFGVLLYYLLWFLLGVGLFQNRDRFLPIIGRPSIIALCLLGGFMSTLMTGAAHEWSLSLDDHWLLFLVLAIQSTISTVVMGIGIIGFFHSVFGTPNALVTWLVELSYSIYLVHIIFVVVVSSILLHLELGPFPTIWLTALLAFPLCVLAYYIVIKFTPLNWFVNGYKKSWFKFPRFGRSNTSN